MSPPASPIPPWADASPLRWRSRLRRWQFTLSPPRDPWARVATPIDWPSLMQAAPADWRGYLSGASTAKISGLEELCTWLAACRYVPDRERGDGRDRWMHPLEFEASRTGDCEDYALWAWRKLIELGFAAEFVVGLFEPTGCEFAVNHAWVHVHDGSRLRLLESTAAERERMLLPLDAARAAYLPAASIDHRLESHAFANFFHFRARGRSLPLPPRTAAQGSANAT